MLDLLQLIKNGESGGVRIGSTTPEELCKLLGPDYAGERGPIPFSSWITEAWPMEFYFQGLPPKLYSLKLCDPDSNISWSGGRVDSLIVEPIKAGNLLISFGEIGWSELLSLPTALNHLQELGFTAEGLPNKEVAIGIQIAERKSVFVFRLEPKHREGGLYDIDYHFNALRCVDYAADAELSATLPKTAPSRAEVFEDVADSWTPPRTPVRIGD